MHSCYRRLARSRRVAAHACRVVVAPGVHRYSCAYFTVPAWNAWVQPLVPAAAATAAAAAAAAALAATLTSPSADSLGNTSPRDAVSVDAAAAGSDAAHSSHQPASTESASTAAPPTRATSSSTSGVAVEAVGQLQDGALGPTTNTVDAAAAASTPVNEGKGEVASEAACAVLVSATGCSLAPGATGVRVIDYIQAKYKFHFQDAGKQAGGDEA